MDQTLTMNFRKEWDWDGWASPELLFWPIPWIRKSTHVSPNHVPSTTCSHLNAPPNPFLAGFTAHGPQSMILERGQLLAFANFNTALLGHVVLNLALLALLLGPSVIVHYWRFESIQQPHKVRNVVFRHVYATILSFAKLLGALQQN
jgi:hypothetical protein